MRITWINPARIEQRNGSLTSDRACVRLRCVGPAIDLLRRGHEVMAVALFDWQQWANDPTFYNRDVFVLGKAFADVRPIIQRIHESGGKVVIDLCDNVFEPPEDGLKQIYEWALPMADGVATSSETLRVAVARHIPERLPIVAIPDCVEGNRQVARFAPSSDVLRLLWFGYPNNLPLVHQGLPALGKVSQRLRAELTLVTAWVGQPRQAFEGKPHGLETRLIEWSVETMASEFARCDMAVIPSDDSPARITKSANKVITSLWAGRYVAAYPLPSYATFAPFAGIGRDLTGNIVWAVQNQTAVVERIVAGQEFIASHYASENIGKAWESFAEKLHSEAVD
jgi:hypothetical protein